MRFNRSFDDRGEVAVLIGAALMACTYCVFSIRSLLDPAGDGELLSAKRLLAVAAGVGVFLMIAARAQRFKFDGLLRMAGSLLLTAGAGMAALFALRVGYDWYAGEMQAIVARNLRGLLAWFGYLAAAIACYFGIGHARSRRQRAPKPQERTVADILTRVSAWPVAERRALIAALDASIAYEEADALPTGTGAVTAG